MKKIINFFNFLGEKTSVAFDRLKSLLFKKSEFEKKMSFKKGLTLGIGIAIILIIIIGLGWWGWNKFFTADKNAPTPIAEAKVYIITSSQCGQKCWDTDLFIDALVQNGVKVVRKQKAYVSWLPFSLGNQLVKKYSITKVPTVVVEFTGQNQPDISQFFNAGLGRVVDGGFVLDKILAPYYDLVSKKVKGLVKVTYLDDKTCEKCYDISRHEIALKNLGVNVKGRTIDISSKEGQELINKYKITKVPTLLITGEVSEYSVLTQAWADVGIVADDGTYIFTNIDLMGEFYKDLSTGQIVEAKPTPAAATPAE